MPHLEIVQVPPGKTLIEVVLSKKRKSGGSGTGPFSKL